MILGFSQVGKQCEVSLLGKKVKGRCCFQRRGTWTTDPNRGLLSSALWMVWETTQGQLRSCQAISPTSPAQPTPEQARTQQFHFTSSSPNRPGGWSAGRRTEICPGKRASHLHRPQLWGRKQEGEQTNHGTQGPAKSLTLLPSNVMTMAE